MVPRSTPDSRIHTKSVEPDNASGRPDEKPSSNTIKTRRCRYTARPSRQEARGTRSGFLIEADAASGAVMKGCYQIRVRHIITAYNINIVIARLDRATQYSRDGRWGHAASTSTS